MELFSLRLQELRKEKKQKQTDIASLLKITVRHYQDIEYGKLMFHA